MIEKDNDKLVEVMDKKLSLLRVCISKNAGLGLMTRIRCTLGICLGKKERLSKKKKAVVSLRIVCEIGGSVVSSGVGLVRNYKSKKVSLKESVVLEGRGIHYERIVKSV